MIRSLARRKFDEFSRLSSIKALGSIWGSTPGLLAQLEAETLGADGALARIDEAFASQTRSSIAARSRSCIDCAAKSCSSATQPIPAPAEKAFRTAIAIAKEQGARSPVLLASLALARLYQSTGRPVDAHAILAPALEGFAPTPEMPEIADAQALLLRLA